MSKNLVIILISLFIINCGSDSSGGGSSSNLFSKLSGNTFQLEGMDEVMTSLSTACGSSTPTNTSAEEEVNLESALALHVSEGDFDVAGEAESEEVIWVTFSIVIFAVEDGDGDIQYEGNFSVTDGNTIAITIDGTTFLIDVVDLDEEAAILTVELGSTEDLDCSSDSSTGTTGTMSDNDGEARNSERNSE